MKFSKSVSNSLKPIALAMSLTMVMSTQAMADGHKHSEKHAEATEGTMQKWQGEAYQAWLDGKVETALLLNTNLNSFKINTKTANGNVTLFGEVSSEVESELAEEITKGVKGVKGVTNDLKVDVNAKRNEVDENNKSFSQFVSDASITASVKTKLLLEDDVKGLKVDVDTDYSVVTLSGVAGSDTKRDLVEAIAKNTDSVKSVVNNLKIK